MTVDRRSSLEFARDCVATIRFFVAAAISTTLIGCQSLQETKEAMQQTDTDASSRFGSKHTIECDAKHAGGTRLGPYSVVRHNAKDKILNNRLLHIKDFKDLKNLAVFVAPYRTTGLAGKGVAGLGCIFENFPKELKLVDHFRGSFAGVRFRFKGVE